MTSHRHYEIAATIGAVILAGLAAACVYRGLYLIALGFAMGVAVLAEAAARERRRHRRLLEEHDWARRNALGLNPPPLTPCCLLGQASRGTTHRNCTRPSTKES